MNPQFNARLVTLSATVCVILSAGLLAPCSAQADSTSSFNHNNQTNLIRVLPPIVIPDPKTGKK